MAIVRPARDSLATAYSIANGPQQNYGRIMIRALDIQPGMTVVDFGCGTGDLALFLAELVGPTGKVIGIEPMQDRVDIATKRATDSPHLNVSFLVGDDVTLLVLITEEVDAVIMNAVFHWIKNKPEALTAIASILRPGGKLGISSGSGAGNPLAPKFEALSEYPYGDYPMQGVPEFLAESELKQQLVAAGFGLVTINTIDHKETFASRGEMMNWLEATTSGTLWCVDYLPRHMREPAVQSIRDKYNALEASASGAFELPVTMLYTVAYKI
ncbi:S-adenosyl-L-methionine-dependent methyltransferase [Mycena galericulata]|nr:S-adenosyl-L-methionine-dependent methyltransferase [Mycena galericulata]